MKKFTKNSISWHMKIILNSKFKNHQQSIIGRNHTHHLRIACGFFHNLMAESNSWDRDCVAHKSKIFTVMALYRKHLRMNPCSKVYQATPYPSQHSCLRFFFFFNLSGISFACIFIIINLFNGDLLNTCSLLSTCSCQILWGI